MKKILCTLVVALSLAACNNGKKEESIQHEKDSLQNIIKEQDAMLGNYTASFTDIEITLDSINRRQQNILLKTSGNRDMKGSAVSEINTEIAAINHLLDNNRQKIGLLNKQLKTATTKNGQLEAAIKSLNEQLSAKETELADLHTKLNSLNSDLWQLEFSVGVLSIENAVQAAIITDDMITSRTAYYIVGTASELEKEKIIDKKGGLLGIGKTAELSSDFDAAKFTKVDYLELTSIPLHCISAKVITSHPQNSYKLQSDQEYITGLTINDPERFWRNSKYLVIVEKR